MSASFNPRLGVVIVTYNSEQVVRECLTSLLASDVDDLLIVVVDNASSDNTVEVVNECAHLEGAHADPSGPNLAGNLRDDRRIHLIKSDLNAGYAGGVNIGLRYLQRSPGVELFWILNPDCRVLPDTASKYLACAEDAGTFGLIGGRVLLVHPENVIQSDGGMVNAWTGICKNINLSKDAASTPFPNMQICDYISGANLVASREFIDKVGLMREDYFLYYEEVDWAFRRGDEKLVYAKGATVLHHAGTSIGSPVIGKEFGTAFSNYFNYRSRMHFMRNFFPARVPVAYGYSFLKVIRLLLQGHFDEAMGAFCGLNNLAPPKSVRARLARATFAGPAW